MIHSTIVIVTVHSLHVLFAIFWFGSVLYANFVLFPRLGSLPADEASALQASLRTGRARHITVIAAIGTVGLGILRGLFGGALKGMPSLYGWTYVGSAVLGLLMVAFVLTRGFGKANLGWLFIPAFFVMFCLMVAMRFGY